MRNLIICFLSAGLITPSFASSNIVQELTYIGFGYKHSTFESGALADYLDDKYSNDEDKSLGGLYLNAGLSLTESIYLEGEADFVTRVSSEVDSWKLGAGYNAVLNERLSIPTSCGVVNYRADSNYSDSFSEQAAYCRSGARFQAAKHWLIDLAYQHDFLDVSKDAFKMNNVFQFGSVFGLVAGVETAKRTHSETTFNFGIQFTM